MFNSPTDGGWGAWDSYGSCTVTCGGGTQRKSRSCDNPVPQHGGMSCPGGQSQIQTCNSRMCPTGKHSILYCFLKG